MHCTATSKFHHSNILLEIYNIVHFILVKIEVNLQSSGFSDGMFTQIPVRFDKIPTRIPVRCKKRQKHLNLLLPIYE